MKPESLIFFIILENTVRENPYSGIFCAVSKILKELKEKLWDLDVFHTLQETLNTSPIKTLTSLTQEKLIQEKY